MLLVWGGALLGFASFAVGPGGQRLSFEEIFVPGGWWDVSPASLLAERITKVLGGLGPALRQHVGALPPAAAAGSLTALVVLACGVGVLIARRGQAGQPMAALLGTGGALAMLVLTPLVLCVLVWGVAALNFWAFALLALLWQRWRHRAW